MVKQYLFVDESGDLGNRAGSSAVFVITGVLFSDKLSELVTSEALNDLRKELGLSERYEFKFHRSRNKVKAPFYNKAKYFDCRYYSLTIRKSVTYKPHNYTHCLTTLIKFIAEEHISTQLNLQIIIDGQRSRTYQTKIRSFVRSNTLVKVENIKFSNSRNDNLVQLADMCSGLVYEVETNSGICFYGDFYKNIRRFYLNP